MKGQYTTKGFNITGYDKSNGVFIEKALETQDIYKIGFMYIVDEKKGAKDHQLFNNMLKKIKLIYEEYLAEHNKQAIEKGLKMQKGKK